MASLLPESRRPELPQSPDRFVTSRLPASKQPLIGALEKVIKPVYLHQRIPENVDVPRKKPSPQDQYSLSNERATIKEGTTKKQRRYFSDLEATPLVEERPSEQLAPAQSYSEDSSLKVQYYEKEVENLKAIIEDLKSDSSRREQIKLLLQQNESLRESTNKLKGMYMDAQKRISTLQADQITANKLLSSEKDLADARRRCTQLERQNEAMKNQLRQERNWSAKGREGRTTLLNEQNIEKELQALRKQIEELATKLQLRDQQLLAYEQLSANYERLTGHMAQLTAGLQQSKHEASRLENELSEAHELLRDYKTTIERKDGELESALQQTSELRCLLVSMNIDNIQGVDKNAAEAKKKLEQSLEESEHHRQQQFREIAEHNDKLMRQQVQLKAELSTVKTDSQLLNSHVRLLRTEKESLLSEIQSLKHSIDVYLKSEYDAKSHEIEAHLVPQSFPEALSDSEFDHLKQSLRGFRIKLERICQQISKGLEGLKSL